MKKQKVVHPEVMADDPRLPEILSAVEWLNARYKNGLLCSGGAGGGYHWTLIYPVGDKRRNVPMRPEKILEMADILKKKESEGR